MPFLCSKFAQMKDRVASLEWTIRLMQGLVTKNNFFFDLPHELQLKILVINLLSDLPFNFLLARKQLFVKHEKATTLRDVAMWGINAFDLKMWSLSDSYRTNSPHYRFLGRMGRSYHNASRGYYDHCLGVHAYYATPIDDVYYEVVDWQSSFKQDNGRMPTKRCDPFQSPVVNKIIGHMRVNKLADFLTGKVGKKELQQSCDENGIKWFKSWTIKRLKKELMAT
jgi:hypothetical protein